MVLSLREDEIKAVNVEQGRLMVDVHTYLVKVVMGFEFKILHADDGVQIRKETKSKNQIIQI